MPYEVTATKKRPQSFDSLVGQDFVVSTLKSSLELGRIAHAYLFSGPRGVGKTSAARILAKALNCEKGPTVEPCGECSLCREIARGNSLDVIEIDGASNTSVNDVRELKDEVLFAPNSGRYKIYIIDEVHMLSNSAFNALLKTIEEPPPYIVFIFATTEVHKVPATIRSRCQQFNFRLIPVEIIKNKLRETTEELGLGAEDEALFWIAKEATGSLRDAYTLFDQIASFSQEEITLAQIQEKLGLVGVDAINDIAESMADEDGTAVMEKAQEIFAQGVAVEQFVIDLAEYLRNILFLTHGVDRESLLGYPPSRFSGKVREAFTPEQIEYALSRLFELFRNLRFSLNQRFETELVLSDLSSLPRRISSKALLERIDGLRAELQGAGGKAGSGSAAGRAEAVSADTVARPRKVGESESGEVKGRASSASEPTDRASSAGDTSGGSSAAGNPAAGSSTAEESAAPDSAGGPEQDSTQASPGEEESAETTYTSDSRTLGKEEIDRLVAGLKSRPSLASAVQQAVGWKIEDKTLTITGDSSYSANKIRAELPTLVQLASRILGKKYDIHVRASGDRGDPGESKDESVDEQAELVKKVFRGHIVENGAAHESDGPV